MESNFNFILCYSSIFMKSKTNDFYQHSVRLTMDWLVTCDLFYSVFFPSNVFTCIHEIFQKIITPRFSDAGLNKKVVEMNVYKFLLDMVECIFMDGKYMISCIKKHNVIPQIQILYLFLREGFKITRERASTFFACIYP